MCILNMTMPRLNRVVIIGGTSGIGLATAHYLKKKGYDVIVTGRRSLTIGGIETFRVDIRSEKSIKKLFEVSLAKYRDINALIFSAGITVPPKSIRDFDISLWNDIIATNVTGALLTLKHAYAVLKKNRGKVVIINSLAARQYSKLSGLEYTISKAALGGLVRQLSIEWAPDNILINSVYPGMTMTPMLEKNVSEIRLKEIEAKIPLGRIAKQEEIAHAVEFLISSENTYMTGTGLDICGGQNLSG